MSYASEIRRLRGEVQNVLAKHEQTRDLTDFARYAADPLGFFRDVLRCDAWEMQCAIAESVRDNPRTCVVSANSMGKDWLCARLALWWVFACRGLCILTGPTERQVKHILMARELRQAFARAPELPGELLTLELRVDDTGECGILALTSDSADRLTGFHHPRLMICVTEAQGVSDAGYEAMAACATGAENRLFVYGNPTRPTGSFHRVAQSSTWNTITLPADVHPNVIAGREVIPGGITQEWVETMRQEYGAGSSIYGARVLAQFPTELLDGLVRAEWLRAAVARWNEVVAPPTGDPRIAAQFAAIERRGDAAFLPPPVLALDVARYGPDSSALAFVQGGVVRELVTWRSASVTDSVARVIKYGERIQQRDIWGRRPELWVDEPGLGGGAIDLLRERGWATTAFNGAAKSRDSRFLNLRAESHWHFRQLLEKGQCALPPDSALEEEALAVEWQINAAGKVQMLSKDTVRSTIGRSPDRLDAVVIGLTAATGRVLGGTVSFEPVAM